MRNSITALSTLFALATAAGCGVPGSDGDDPATIGQIAAGLTATDRCQLGYAADYVETVTHPGGQVGTSFPSESDPQNFIFPGDVVRVTVTGSVRYDLWGASAGPGGNGRVADNSFPFPGLGQIASVARWNNNPAGWVGSPMQTTSLAGCTAAPNYYPVRLLYYLNDGQLWDNGGSFTIRTEVFRAPGRVVLEGIELTQGVQTAGNKVPLIAGKRTFVRAYVRGTDDGRGALSGVTATATVDGVARTFLPIPNTSITASLSGSDRRSLGNSFLFEIDGPAIAAGTRKVNVTVVPPPGRGDGVPITRYATATFSAPSGNAAQISFYAARYSYYNVPVAMQGLTGRSDGWWMARPAAAWEPMRVTAENAVPSARVVINDLAPAASWGSAYFDCRGTQDRFGNWGCGGYEDGRNWAISYIDGVCPGGGCWMAVLQPEITGGVNKLGAHTPSPRGNHVINLQGEQVAAEQGLTLAHEIGHGLGLPHTWDDASYPRLDGALGPYNGFRYSPANSIVAGTDALGNVTAFDMMSYRWPLWFSPYNYCKALANASSNGIVCPADTPR